jgi:hypothetical protein
VSPGDGSNRRAPESADFAARVGGARRRPPIAILAWVVVLGGFVAVGLSGRFGGAGAAAPGAVGTAAASTLEAESTGRIASSSFRIVEGSRSPRFDPDFPTPPPVDTTETSPPGPLSLEATRHPSAVFVHGEVFADKVTWVFVSLQTLDGQVGGWASVSIPGAAGEASGRPALRFDVELAIPTGMATGVLMVQANAYDATGGIIASTGVRLAAEM